MAPALALPRVLFDQQCRFWHQRHPAPRHRDTRAKPKQLLSPYRKYHYCRIKGQGPFFYRDNFLPPCRVSSPAKERQYQGTAGCPIEAQEEKKADSCLPSFCPGTVTEAGAATRSDQDFLRLLFTRSWLLFSSPLLFLLHTRWLVSLKTLPWNAILRKEGDKGIQGSLQNKFSVKVGNLAQPA